jgi:hypothetical protein
MLARLLLIFVQLSVAWVAAPVLMAQMAGLGSISAAAIGLGRLDVFLFGAVAAIVIWLVGLIVAVFYEDLPRPSVMALAAAVLGGFAGALASQSPDLVQAVTRVIPQMPLAAYPLILAAIGYTIAQ